MKIKALFFLPGAIALILGASPMISSFNNAAVAGTAPNGGWERKFDQLNLTDAQKAQIQQIRETSRQQMDAVFTPEQKEQLRTAKEQRQRPNLNLTEDQKAQLKAIGQNAQSQIDAILTPEQKQKLQELQQQWRQRHQQQQSN